MMQYRVWIFDVFYQGHNFDDYVRQKAGELQFMLESKHAEFEDSSEYVTQSTLKEVKFQNSAGEMHRVYEVKWYHPEYGFYSWEGVIKSLHLNFYCIVEFMCGAEDKPFCNELYREISGPDDKVWFKENRSPVLDEKHTSYEPDELSSNPSLADVVDEYLEEAAIYCEMKEAQK